MPNGLQIQINDLDSYQSSPSHLDQFQNVPKVPVIRIYGALRVPGNRPTSYNVLLHIHNAYPYLFIDCLQMEKTKQNQQYLDEFTKYIENVLTDSFRKTFTRDVSDEDDSSDSEELLGTTDECAKKYVASINFCRGSPVYGYKVGYALVLKVSFFSQLYRSRFFKLVGQKAIDFSIFASKPLQKKYPQVYEAHLTHCAQFCADMNLQPCGFLCLESCYFRSPVIGPNELPLSPLKQYLSSYIARNNVLSPAGYPRMGRSILELDCHVGDILNRRDLQQREIHNDFTEFVQGMPGPQVFLTSKKSTYEELKFQCAARGKSNMSELLTESYSQIFPNIGKAGYSDWEQKTQYEQQMRFASQLNRPTGYTSINAYYKNVIQKDLCGVSFPTVFELVDLTMPMSSFQEISKLNFRDDLVRWHSYEMLFQPYNSDSSHISLDEKSPETSSSQTSKLSSSTQSIYTLRSSDSNRLSVSSDNVHGGTKRKANNSSSKNISGMDKNKSQRIESPHSNSTESLFSQSSDQLLRNPHQIWECVIPRFLTKLQIRSTMRENGLIDYCYSDPSYTNSNDKHALPLTFANRIISVPVQGDSPEEHLKLSEVTDISFDTKESHLLPQVSKLCFWQYSLSAPSKKDVLHWIEVENKSEKYKEEKFRSQIEPVVTQTNDFVYSLESNHVPRHANGFIKLTLLCMELLAYTNFDMRPDPASDEIALLIYHFDNANEMFADGKPKTVIMAHLHGIDLWILRKNFRNIASFTNAEIQIFSSEKEMLQAFVSAIDLLDPDILAGYEVNASSWGYLCERYQKAYDINLIPRLSRVNSQGNGKFGDRWGYTHTSSLKINGRHIFNVWRFLKSDLKLTSYSLENISFHLLHHSLPRISNQELTSWFRSGSVGKILMVCSYFTHRINLVMTIIDKQEIVLNNAESSRLLGVDFYSNYYRGSQFKVESLLMRIAKTENSLLNSPTKEDVHNMRALEVIPLIMEPESNFYKSPLVILDFQSLYPSIMIAYNYCYTTLLGRIEGYRQSKNTIGYIDHHEIPKGLIAFLMKHQGLNISPNGLMFVSSKFRKSLLSKMLEEILNMRINVKTVASAFSGDKGLEKILNSKQLALKLTANVTYGYTSASFSGRMPNSDIADAIVATGRELMRKSIEMIESSPIKAKVVYGDTDSLFVYFPGRSKQFAFEHGKKFADMVTNAFPDPIKLKFEKVYHPCVLLSKKRYVGNSFENESQINPKFEAKGIETIRRDGIPAQQRLVGKSLRILFETKDLSAVKTYVLKQFFKILFNRVNVSDFCFAKGVRYGTYKNEQNLPPGAIIAKKNIQRDPRSEPQYKERVPYLVIRDAAKERLRDRCVSPEEYMSSFKTRNPMELDFEYYITKVLIPPMERIFNLMGVNLQEWYKDMPKSTRSLVSKHNDISNITGFSRSDECANCGSSLDKDSTLVCQSCFQNKLQLVLNLAMARRCKEQSVHKYKQICAACSRANYNIYERAISDACVNQDCRIYYAKVKSTREYEQLMKQTNIIFNQIESLQW